MHIVATLALCLSFAFVGCSPTDAEATSDSVTFGNSTPKSSLPEVTPGQPIPREFIDQRDVAAVRHFLDNGADIDADVDRGVTALLIAIAMRADGVIDLLLDHGADVNQGSSPAGETPLISCAILDRLDLAKRLVALGADVHAESKHGRNPMGVVAHMGLNDWVVFLLESGVGVDETNRLGTTALHSACGEGRKEIVALLLERGANPDLPDQQNSAPLMEAVKDGCFECVELLIARGADVNRATKHYEETPLIVATQKERTEVVKLLLDHGADRSLKDSKGRTALDHARKKENSELIGMLE